MSHARTARTLHRALLLFSLLPAGALGAAPSIGGIVNCADYGPVISSGTIVAIYGTDLASNIVIATEKPLPTTLDGVSVVVRAGGQETDAALYFVSAGQINAQLPYGLGGQQVEVLVRNAEGESNAVPIALQTVSPSFYTKTADGLGEALLVHFPSYELVSEASPATPNEVVLLYLSGLGEVTPTVAAGTPAGDGAGLGPLNIVNQPVEVWIGGQQATVFWAGLAPGFAGLYQVNLIMPATLPTGMAEITVLCGGGQTQANVTVATVAEVVEKLAPEEVVKRALEAQTQGDIEGMLSYWALDRYDEAAVAEGRAALALLSGGVTLSNFQFHHLATGYGDLGNLALVRAEISYTMAAPGLTADQTAGIFATLVGGEGQWKIYSIDPDDLQNMVIYDRQQPNAAKASAVQRYAGLRTPEQVSNDLNYTMVNTAANEGKMAADGIMNRIGAIPGGGDAAAVVYHTGCIAYDACETVDAYKRNGFSAVFFLNLSQVAVGAVQIVTEPIPGADTAADMVQLYLERITSMHELREGVQELSAAVRTPRADYNAWLFLPPESVWKRPDGFEESVSPDVEVAYGRPLQLIGLTKAASIDKPIPFVVVGEVPVPGGLEKIAERLGAKKVDAEWKMPLDITQLALDDGDMNEGDEVLQEYRKQVGPKGTGLVVAWKSSCVRGFQKLKVPLANGEIAFGPEVINKYMNFMQQLDVPQLEQGKLKVGVDQTKQFQVIGTGLPDTGTIDLSTKFECLQMRIEEGGHSFAQLHRSLQKLEVEGLEGGAATLKLILPGPESRLDQFPDIEADVPIEVAGSGESSWTSTRSFLFYNNRWNATTATTVTTDGELLDCEDRAVGGYQYLKCKIPPADSNPPKVDSYTVTVNLSGVSPVAYNGPQPADDWEQVVMGRFAFGAEVEGDTFTKTIQVPRGPGSYQVNFEIVVRYRNKKKPEEVLHAATELVFKFWLQRN